MAHSKQGEFLGHPKGLYVLFFTEMWERFSYYGMRAMLLLYMINYFKWTQEHSASIYKWYTSLVYLTPLLGGYLADRYLGNKRAIIIGASLMAIGHFFMAFEQIPIFYAALVFLIIGNGFFKPNMSVQVGQLYPKNDPRRDSAYTIFYMGINLGAFLSPIICGWLRLNTKWEYHAGFTAAGVGMVLGLVVYLLGQRWVNEVPEDETYQGDQTTPKDGAEVNQASMTEEEAAKVPSVVPSISKASPGLLIAFGVLAILAGPLLWSLGFIKADDALAFSLGGGFAGFMGSWIASKLDMAIRDRVLAIYIVAVFVVFFWVAFEQAGSAINVYADKTTNRYITQPLPTPPLFTESKHDETKAETEHDTLGIIGAMRESWAHFNIRTWWTGLWNPVSTEWFQSINALAIFCLAPIFAWLWLYLPRHGIRLSIPAKVTIGVFLQAVAFGLMALSIQSENKPSSAPLAELPPGVIARANGMVVFRDPPDLDDDKAFDNEVAIETVPDKERKVVQGGRILFDRKAGKLNMTGVLPDTDRDRLLRATAPFSFVKAIKELADKTHDAKKDADGQFSVSIKLDEVPPGLDLRYAGLKKDDLRFDDASKTLTAKVELKDKDYKQILVAGSDLAFREALNKLYVDSAKFKVSPWWLVWFYILCTLGELCLSPVGLSMVSKLAPARFATMLMGIWLLTSFFGNFFAGFAGEAYGTVHPTKYFLVVALVVGGAAFVCMLFVKITKAMMHGVE